MGYLGQVAQICARSAYRINVHIRLSRLPLLFVPTLNVTAAACTLPPGLVLRDGSQKTGLRSIWNRIERHLPGG